MRFISLLIVLALIKQISAECYQPANLLKSLSQIKRVECGAWTIEEKINDGNSPKFNQEGTPSDESMFQVTFTCALVDQDELCKKAENSFINAGKIISSVLKLNTKIKVNAQFFNFCKTPPNCSIRETKVIGAAGPTNFYSLMDEVDGSERLYPQALVKQFNFQEHPMYEEFDILAMFNSRFTYHFDGDVTPMKANDVDFTYVITHELFHGLGFLSSWSPLNDPSGQPLGLIPAVVSLDSGADGHVIPKFDEPITVKEFIFDKFMIRLDDGTFISNYTKKIHDFFVAKKDVMEVMTYEQFEKTPEFRLMQDMLRLSTTPKSLGFLPHDTTDYIKDSAILETSYAKYDEGSSVSHLDFATYFNTSDFMMMAKAISGKTHDELIKRNESYTGGMIGPKIKSILESMGSSNTLVASVVLGHCWEHDLDIGGIMWDILKMLDIINHFIES
ncbi:10035_t:CDS:2 [Funneliformis mosseae]|uniref:10035_t:CDS:1 n=1 Tax=Funneliformis mosseae TaxID=27381 RepID=A0A9N8YMR9_FUNMO|nr:10035_t:CDS:2 [Funneliformis mosseae]